MAAGFRDNFRMFNTSAITSRIRNVHLFCGYLEEYSSVVPGSSAGIQYRQNNGYNGWNHRLHHKWRRHVELKAIPRSNVLLLEPKTRQLLLQSSSHFCDQMAFSKSTSFSLVLGAMVLLAIATAHVEASSFTAYSGPGCSGNSEQPRECGCSYISRRSGYSFIYTGRTAAVYNRPSCTGIAHFHFTSSMRGCSPFGWQSIFIHC